MTPTDLVKLGDVATIGSGVGFPMRLQGRSTGKYPFAKVGDISRLARSGRSELVQAGNYVDDDDLDALKANPFPEGTVVFAKIGEAIRQNHRAIVGTPCLVDNNVMGVTPGAKLNSRYLYHFLRTVDLYPLAQSTTVPSIRKSQLERVEIPCLPLGEQQDVANILDHVDSLRAKRRQAISLLDNLAQSVFLDMFGDPVSNERNWERVPLGNLLSRIDSGKSPVCLDRPASGDEWGVLKLGAVTQCVYLPGENKALPESVAKENAHEVKIGDLLFSRKNTPNLVAAVAYVRETRKHLLMPDLIFRLVPRDDAQINKIYLYGLLTYPSKRGKVRSLASGSAASMSNISKSKLRGLECELPPFVLQNEYAARINALEATRSAHRAHLAELDALFASLQHRAFRGELWPENSAPAA